jgi:hypothetical protein
MPRRFGKDVLIIGARGVLGALTANAFREAGWKVRSTARQAAPEQIALDLDSSESVAAVLEENELIVNTVPHPRLLAERAVLERGGVLINTSAMPAAAARSLRAVAGGARGTVLMNAGLAPGVTNVVAADLLHHHPNAEELEIVFTLSGDAPRGPAGADFLYRGLTAVARHRTTVIPLPEPFGERRCLGFAEGDSAWLGGIAEGRVVRLYICIAEAAAHEQMLRLNRDGAMNHLPRSLIESLPLSTDAAPSGEPVAHWIGVKTTGRRLAARTVECRGDFLHAARSTVVFAETLRRHQPPGGCFDPEEVCTLSQIESRLRAAGVTVVPRPG